MTSVSLELLPSCMAVPVYVDEEVVVGRCVFQNFIHEEFEEEGVSDEILNELPEDVLEEEVVPEVNGAAAHCEDENFAAALGHIGIDPESTCWRQVGANIRELANDFAKSKERKILKKEAEKVDVVTISCESFYEMCEQVFLHGVTREKVVALFFFCADVLIKCARSQMKDIGIKLFRWALQFVLQRVCAWVSRHGGWEKAIKNTFSAAQIAAMGAAGAMVVVFGGFLIYKMNSLAEPDKAMGFPFAVLETENELQ